MWKWILYYEIPLEWNLMWVLLHHCMFLSSIHAVCAAGGFRNGCRVVFCCSVCVAVGQLALDCAMPTYVKLETSFPPCWTELVLTYRGLWKISGRHSKGEWRHYSRTSSGWRMYMADRSRHSLLGCTCSSVCLFLTVVPVDQHVLWLYPERWSSPETAAS